MKAAVASPVPSANKGHESSESTILVAESSTSIGPELVEQLRADRYHATLARTVQHACALARTRQVRAVVLGVLDTPRGALDLLEEIRHPDGGQVEGLVWHECIPVIVLSPSVGQLDLLRAFELGADDFMAHPVSYLELRARLKAVLRRAEGLAPARLVRVGPLEIDTGAHLARIAGTPVGLCRLEFELLVHLARNPTEVCSKQELLHAIWHWRMPSGARTVDSHASRLRRKLDAAGAHGFVVNVWGIGYRLT